MKKIEITAYDLAQRFVGTREVGGVANNAQVLAMLQLDESWPKSDEVPWCSAFVNYIAWLLRLPRSKSLMARSWLNVGLPIPLNDATPGFDVVIFWRGSRTATTGHVAFYGGITEKGVLALGGNQSDSVSLAEFPVSQILGMRRLLS